ncbi:ABC transporter ATP-binding protein [Mammaliicoccus sciuri]|uniref:Multidrug ABC transporter ATP-binding protein n=1 Tax=Mammaliicoccus sciuri TaxID=1296 RepID=A0A1C9LUF0_MAMSC|nr:ABC transporter ATP-binding protein [Mammaliicoccus sciuri]AOQ25953.1 multidrug ABC transporter ATP-binding protein [Mammaliicoccus sciuri]MCC2089532.1 ABC transporter ATP-binding protein/permease [Mammaliicoccus sciuri]MCH5139737.1 ABC transporter ATP-binding protein [Mammaliicoccus sciuri]MEB6696820.1 ABC transporter ATP-binding protein/permease [Mammaliicoccus sciuri]OCA12508.1 multidrug ABC transporter permease/ATP-binding protein [Mammaliicoccus sciuri]
MFQAIKKLMWFFKDHWKRYSVAIILLLIANVVEVLPPWIVGQTIDKISDRSLTEQIYHQLVIIFIIVLFLSYIVNYIWRTLIFSGSQILESIMRRKLMQKFLSMSPTFFEKNRTGDLMAKSTNDLNQIRNTAGIGILTLIDSTTFMGTIILTMGITVSWKLTLFALIPLPLLAILEIELGKRIHKRYLVSQKSFGDMNDSVLESIEGVRVTRAYVQEDKLNKDFKNMTESVVEKFMNVEKMDAFFQPITIIITAMSQVIGIGYGAFLVNSGEMTIGGLISFTVYLNMLVWPMFSVGILINIMQRGNASIDRVEETLNEAETVLDVENKGMPSHDIGMNSVVFKYPSSESINLNNINIILGKGETLGIVGATGSGKTTLIKQILKEYPTGDGEIVLGETNINQISKSDLRSLIGYVSQENILFSRSIRDNIRFGKSDATDNEIEEAIKLAYFEKDIERLPQGLETLVGEKGIAISGGQKQRIAIARALIMDPKILILDDALSAVDAKTEKKIIQNIQKYRQGKTTIIATHRLSGVKHANQIVVMDHGEVTESGTHDQLLQMNGWYKSQFERQRLKEVYSK